MEYIFEKLCAIMIIALASVGVASVVILLLSVIQLVAEAIDEILNEFNVRGIIKNLKHKRSKK